MLFKCGTCKKSWTRKEGYNKHFNVKYVNAGSSRTGKLTLNPCHNAEAETRSLKLLPPKNKNQLTLTSMVGKIKWSDNKSKKDGEPSDDQEPTRKGTILHQATPVPATPQPDSQEKIENMMNKIINPPINLGEIKTDLGMDHQDYNPQLELQEKNIDLVIQHIDPQLKSQEEKLDLIIEHTDSILKQSSDKNTLQQKNIFKLTINIQMWHRVFQIGFH